MKVGDPILEKITEVVRSSEGIKAAVLATSMGLPALARVDPLLQAALGSDYNRANQATKNAGWQIVQQMREMGFIDVGSVKMPLGCVADQGRTFRLPIVAA